MPQFYTQARKNDPIGSFKFTDSAPQGVLVYLGTNDYSGTAPIDLDTRFTAAFLSLMANVTEVACVILRTPALRQDRYAYQIVFVGVKN